MTFSAKGNLDNVSSRLATILGPRVVDSLWARRDSNTGFKVMAERDSPPFSWHGPVLMVYPNAKMLSRVGEIDQVTAEIVVPWTAESNGIRDWTTAWLPVSIGTATPPSITPTLGPVAKEALRSLASYVNIGNGLVTKSDKDEAIHTFETLLAHEPVLDEAAVRAWLVGEGGWPGEMGDRAVKILDDLAAGKRIQGRRGSDARLYELWRQRATRDGSVAD